MDNDVRNAQEEHERDLPPQPPAQTSGEPPIIVQTNQDVSGGGGGGGMGVLAGVALVAVILVAIWWFGFGPGTGSGGTDTPSAPAESMAPVVSAPASVAQ